MVLHTFVSQEMFSLQEIVAMLQAGESFEDIMTGIEQQWDLTQIADGMIDDGADAVHED
jgi:hypothetical protein